MAMGVQIVPKNSLFEFSYQPISVQCSEISERHNMWLGLGIAWIVSIPILILLIDFNSYQFPV